MISDIQTNGKRLWKAHPFTTRQKRKGSIQENRLPKDVHFDELCKSGFWQCLTCQKIMKQPAADLVSRFCERCGSHRVKFHNPI
jgi:hypothetical protein